MKSFKIVGVFCIVVGSAFALYVFFAGVRLSLENWSGQQIQNVEIKYGRGTFFTDIVPNKGIRKKSLGKIGEGATFAVKWQESSGRIRQAQFSVYFYGYSGYDSVLIRILPNGEAVLYEGERQYKTNSLSDNST